MLFMSLLTNKVTYVPLNVRTREGAFNTNPMPNVCQEIQNSMSSACQAVAKILL